MNTAGNVKGICVRTLVVMLGVIICGVSVGLFKLVELGADPYTVMNTAISACIGMQFGTLQLLVNIGLFVLVIAFKREFIGFGTIFCMVFLGYTAEFGMWLTRDIQEVFNQVYLRFPVQAVYLVLRLRIWGCRRMTVWHTLWRSRRKGRFPSSPGESLRMCSASAPVFCLP